MWIERWKHDFAGKRLCGAALVFLAIFFVGLGWMIYTDHVWEDYYITFRAAKNLATGHGLVFSPGERVHSFTSPLGVLLPALASAVTGNSSDASALLLFRLVSITALAGAVALLWQTARRLCPAMSPALLLVGLFATDNKIIDYSVNGMETGLLIFFLAWTVSAMFTNPPRQVWHLGLSWAGLMWTRPDSCIYIAAIAIGILIFTPRHIGRGALLKTFGKAGLITTAVYLPWLMWSSWYFGSAVPHTIKAKGLFHDNSLPVLGRALLQYPGQLWRGESSLAATFVPPYGLEMGWPPIVARVSLAISSFLLILWMLPRIR